MQFSPTKMLPELEKLQKLFVRNVITADEFLSQFMDRLAWFGPVDRAMIPKLWALVPEPVRESVATSIGVAAAGKLTWNPRVLGRGYTDDELKSQLASINAWAKAFVEFFNSQRIIPEAD
jgi:hypothetical protein